MSTRFYPEDVIKDRVLLMQIIRNMRNHGGSFVQRLSDCFLAADDNNLIKLANAFSNYLKDYHPGKWK